MSKITFKQYLNNETMGVICDVDSDLTKGTLVEIDEDNDLEALADEALNNVYLVAENIAASDTAQCVLYPVAQKDTLCGFLATPKIAGEVATIVGKGCACINNEFVPDTTDLFTVTNEAFYITNLDTSKVWEVTPVATDATTFVTCTVTAGEADIAVDTRFTITGGKPVESATGAYKTAVAYDKTADTTTIKAYKYLQKVETKLKVQ